LHFHRVIQRPLPSIVQKSGIDSFFTMTMRLTAKFKTQVPHDNIRDSSWFFLISLHWLN
jgi:hypothetical protein